MRQLKAMLWARVRATLSWIASVRTESKLKVGFVSVSALVLWLGVFGFALLLFAIFERFGQDFFGDTGSVKLTDLVLDRLLSVIALAIFGLLVVSNVLVSFATVYRAREVSYLLQAPVSIPTFFLARFVECVSFSSWALAFLGSPFLLAYGLERAAHPAYYVALVLFYPVFVVLPAALGALILVVLVRLLAGRSRKTILTVLALVAVVVFATFQARVDPPELEQAETVQAVLDTMSQTQHPLLPSHWLTSGLVRSAQGDLGGAVFYWLVLLSNSLLVTWLATVAASLWFYEGWTRLGSGDEQRGPSTVRSRSVVSWDTALRWLPRPTAALIAKDLRTFWRDPAQWSQFLIFFGLMALYVANIRNTGGMFSEPPWRDWIALLNSTASMLILATLTTRFVFPLISLEGRRVWILGIAPLGWRRLMRQKFLLSVGTTSIFTVGLAILSGLRLDLSRTELTVSVLGIACATIALSGLAVGLGSLFPNFEEDNPAKITSGLGGTLNFILSLTLIALLATAQGILIQWRQIGPALGVSREAAAASLLAGAAILTLTTCWIALRLGRRNLERTEF